MIFRAGLFFFLNLVRVHILEQDVLRIKQPFFRSKDLTAISSQRMTLFILLSPQRINPFLV